MTTIAAPICYGCKHFRRQLDAFQCDAYVVEIPDEIVMSRVDHRTPYIGDRKIVFDPITPADAAYAELIFSEDEEE